MVMGKHVASQKLGVLEIVTNKACRVKELA